MLIAAALVTYAWRFTGVLLSGRVSADGELFRWIGCVVYAILAALVVKLVLLPEGPLATVALPVRIGATLFGVAVFYAARRNQLVAVFAGGAALGLATWWFGVGG